MAKRGATSEIAVALFVSFGFFHQSHFFTLRFTSDEIFLWKNKRFFHFGKEFDEKTNGFLMICMLFLKKHKDSHQKCYFWNEFGENHKESHQKWYFLNDFGLKNNAI